MNVRTSSLAAVALVASAMVAPANAQTALVPTFEKPKSLLYEFDKVDEAGRVIEPGRYHIDMHAIETILRQGRRSVVQFDARFTIEIEASSASRESDEPFVEYWDVYVVDLDLHRHSQSQSYEVKADSEGMTIHRSGQPPQVFSPQDKYGDEGSVGSLINHPGRILCRNGAVRKELVAPAIFRSLNCDWMFDSLPMLLPALPTQEVTTGQRWRSGMPVLMSCFAQPRIIRIETQFSSVDVHRGHMDVSWSGQPASVALEPIDGVHHVEENAVGQGNLTGTLRLDLDSNQLESASYRMKSRVYNSVSTTSAEFDFSARLDRVDVMDANVAVVPVLETP